MIAFFLGFYRFWRGLRMGFKDPDFQVLLVLAVSILSIGTFFYHGTEGWGWIDSLYFSVTTLTTVGFGDFAPHTTTGKVFTIIYLFIGIGILLSFINVMAHHAVEDSKKNPDFISRRFFGRKSTQLKSD